jgi:hypothetical protein
MLWAARRPREIRIETFEKLQSTDVVLCGKSLWSEGVFQRSQFGFATKSVAEMAGPIIGCFFALTPPDPDGMSDSVAPISIKRPGGKNCASGVKATAG